MMQALELVKDRKTKEPAPQATAAVFEETKKQRRPDRQGRRVRQRHPHRPDAEFDKRRADILADAIDAGLTVAAKM